ncbi:MAG: CHAT domain-containing protein [Chloroflexi bacterium]|nr:CHAT domain-containing protein [Chloroflexota bacterium]
MPENNSHSFIDFDIRVFKGGEGMYIVTAQASESGGAQAALDWDALNSDEFRAMLEQIREEPFTTDETLFQNLGRTLFDALFRGDVRDAFMAVYSQRVAATDNTYLRIRLDIDERAPEIARLPWEFLWEPDLLFLATQTKTLLTRQYLNLSTGPIKSIQVSQPRALLVIPRVHNLDTADEEARIVSALEMAGIAYKVLSDQSVTMTLLADELAAEDYHILHFIGHGDFEEADDGAMHGLLRFNSGEADVSAQEDEVWIKDTHLQQLLSGHDSLRLVVLNSCKGAEVSKRRTGSGFIGAAPAILRAHIPAVVAMQYEIRDSVARQFAETFYKRLTQGRWCGQVDIAVAEARAACFLEFPNDRGFATPILYLRSADGRLFECSKAEKATHERKSETPETEKIPECPPAEEPNADLRHEYRNVTIEALLTSVDAIDERLVIIQRNIEQLETARYENPALFAVENGDLRIERLSADREKLAREKEEKGLVLRWMLYEACQEWAKLNRELNALRDRRAELEAQDQRVPYSLNREISEKRKRALELEDILLRGAKYYPRN